MMRNYFLRVCLLTLLILPTCGVIMSEARVSGSLDHLDNIVANRKEFEKKSQLRIMEALAVYSEAKTDSQKYDALRNLYDAYRTFRIDSALIVADERLSIARRMGVGSKIASASLNLAESYVKSGLPDEALRILDTLQQRDLAPHHVKYRNSVYRTAYSLKASSSVLPSERMETMEKIRKLQDEALANANESSKGFYTLQAEKLKDAGLYKEAMAKMEEAEAKFDFTDDAAMQYIMGELYASAGEKDKAIQYLASSAAIDISSGIKEYRSLILLAALLFEEGDVSRAFDYINCAFEDAEFSNANLRTPDIMTYLPAIHKAFNESRKRSQHLTSIFLWTSVGFIIVLIVTGVMLVRALRSNKRMLDLIENINISLKEKNRQLCEADSLKLQNINTLMMSYARYLSRLKVFRKFVFRLLKTGQYDKAMDTLKSDKADAGDIAAFHELFDETFLSMYPGFVDSVNSLLKEPISQKEKNRLNPELRVMALMKLGLSSTEEISEILKYSAQTVYNLRNSIRNMTGLPRDLFEERLRSL